MFACVSLAQAIPVRENRTTCHLFSFSLRLQDIATVHTTIHKPVMSPNATVEFTGPTFEGLFEVMQEADERTGLDGLTRPRRVTASEIYELHDVDEREELNRLSAMIIGPPSRQKRGLALCHKFNEMHGEPHRIGRGLLIGKERRKDGFLGTSSLPLSLFPYLPLSPHLPLSFVPP